MDDKFTEFYKRYESFMYYIAYDMLKDSYAAEDAVQTAFMNIFRNFQGVEEIGSKKTRHFVATVIKRVVIDMYRQRQRYKITEISLEEFRKNGGDQQGTIIIETNELMECMGRIPKKYADVLLLKYVDGYKIKEIAESIGCAQGTVSSLIHRGKKLLREELLKDGIDGI